MRFISQGPCVIGLACSAVWMPTAFADFIGDSQGKLTLLNYYLNSDLRDEVSSAPNQKSKGEEWAQGFMLDLTSGYTEGVVGFGLDLRGMLGVRLDSSPDRSGSGLLPQESSAVAGGPSYAKRAQSEYGKLGVTGKMRFAQSEVHIGSMSPINPLFVSNGTRLFPQTFLGTELQSKDIDNLVITAGQLNEVKQRDSTDFQKITTTTLNGRFAATQASDHFRYAGADYRFAPNLTGSLYYGELSDAYRQEYAAIKYTHPVGPGTASAEVRLFNASDAGAAYAGNVDNQAVSSNFGYRIGAHSFSAGYQRLYGDTAMPFLNGSATYLFTDILINNFSEANERAWYARYDIDFVEFGLPGLTLSNRYVSASDATVGGVSGYSEWERNTDIGYAFQKGSRLENFSVKLRNGSYRSQLTRGVDQTRLMLTYTVPLF